MTPFTVGITGGSGVGKTYFINKITSYFTNTELCVVSMDHYYKPQEQQVTDQNGIENFDLPTAIDNYAFLDDIRKLKRGEVVIKSEYTFNNANAIPKSLTFAPAPLLLIEGLFVQYFDEVSNELDFKIFIEAADRLKLERRIKRDKEERGYDLNDVLYRYEHHTMPVYTQYIAPLQENADLIVHNNHDFSPSIEVLAGYLRQKLDGIAN